jgi:hypothetical protein
MNAREPIVDTASIKESVAHLGHDLGDLFRAELALFKKEAKQELSGLAVAAVWIGGAAVMGLAAFGAFTAFLMIVLQLVLVPWLAALVVTVAWGAAALSLLAAARAKLQSALPIKFEETTRSVKEDIEWIKSGTKAAK